MFLLITEQRQILSAFIVKLTLSPTLLVVESLSVKWTFNANFWRSRFIRTSLLRTAMTTMLRRGFVQV